MKKSTLIGLSILSVFILCNLSYQPIIADRQIETIPIVDDTRQNGESENCGCISIFKNNYPILICSLLDMMLTPLAFIIFFILVPLQLFILQDIFLIPYTILNNLYYALGCV